jgi:hypothetical protein
VEYIIGFGLLFLPSLAFWGHHQWDIYMLSATTGLFDVRPSRHISIALARTYIILAAITHQAY